MQSITITVVIRDGEWAIRGVCQRRGVVDNGLASPVIADTASAFTDPPPFPSASTATSAASIASINMSSQQDSNLDPRLGASTLSAADGDPSQLPPPATGYVPARRPDIKIPPAHGVYGAQSSPQPYYHYPSPQTHTPSQHLGQHSNSQSNQESPLENNVGYAVEGDARLVKPNANRTQPPALRMRLTHLTSSQLRPRHRRGLSRGPEARSRL